MSSSTSVADAVTTTTTTLGGSVLRSLVQEAAQRDVHESSLDVTGILWLEHINLVVGSRSQAEYFYLEFLGLTKDASKSFHVNLGQQQFHLAENGEPAQSIAGSVGLVVPSLDTLRARIPHAIETLGGSGDDATQFAIVQDTEDCITLTCPWGNTFHIYSLERDVIETNAPTPRKMENAHMSGGTYGPQRMAIRGNPGIRYIEITCPIGTTAEQIATFYRDMLGCTVTTTTTTTQQETEVHVAMVCVGPGVHLCFVESDGADDNLDAQHAKMEGVHICVYANDFVGLYQRLAKRNLIWTNPRFVHLDTCDTLEEAMASRTLRFKHIVDLQQEEEGSSSSNSKLLELEHETRPLRHGQYLKVPKYEPK